MTLLPSIVKTAAHESPNKLTVARLILTAVFVVCFCVPFPEHISIAALIFGVASITDYFDGKIARQRGIVTNFGKLFDPLADKVLIAAAFILLVEKAELPAWIAIVVLAREFCVTGIRLVAAGQGRFWPQSGWGKQNALADHHGELVPGEACIEGDALRLCAAAVCACTGLGAELPDLFHHAADAGVWLQLLGKTARF
ncbi:MAG: CDP-diacylglycerol--glycerol-3-phosphate 3-phosphatidyltransferase [Verrucomicrobiaceae bacterium]|nr:CDP-diacylglycerol--glycerol-3-phosphate 3-phosphatidyltransferase [Verrucomicrobiaceae bacterium]